MACLPACLLFGSFSFLACHFVLRACLSFCVGVMRWLLRYSLCCDCDCDCFLGFHGSVFGGGGGGCCCQLAR
ncbi:hypothetical protein BKA80DRAFT_135235 [Phyllosticta citrichinensis]